MGRRRLAGRPRKTDKEKVGRILVTLDAETLAMISAAGYSNSKLFKYAAEVAAGMLERGEIIEELQKGPNQDTAPLVKKTVYALLNEREAAAARLRAEEEAAQAALDDEINKAIEGICLIRFDMFDGKPAGKIALRGIVEDAPPGLLEFGEVAAFLTLNDDKKHMRKTARTRNEIKEHYNELLRSQQQTPGVWISDGNGELGEASQ